MIIFGIDPALSSLGWGIISVSNNRPQYISSGVIKTTANEEMHKRLAKIALCLQEIIIQYRPSIVALEETYVNMNNLSSLKLGYVRGAIMALIGQHNLSLKEFKPNTIKKTLVGYGHADKQQILHMIKLLLPTASSVTNLDAADAIAVAYTCSVLGSASKV